MFNADLIQEEVEPPDDMRCSGGHIAAPFFRRSGPLSAEEPTKFFKLTHKTADIDGVYCEPCLVVAHFIAKKKRKGKKDVI